MIKDKIVENLARITGLESKELIDDLKIRDIKGFDSLQFVMMISELEEKYSIEIPLDKALEVETIGDLISCARQM